MNEADYRAGREPVERELLDAYRVLFELRVGLLEALAMAEAGYAAPEDVARLRALAEGAKE